jgi:hypothetical protein
VERSFLQPADEGTLGRPATCSKFYTSTPRKAKSNNVKVSTRSSDVAWNIFEVKAYEIE